MREIIQQLNKHSLAVGTGISYSRLRKYSTGQVKKLTKEEIEKIYKYLLSLSNIFRSNMNDE
jgi:DNA-binding Xre family transcriptional regulator